MNKEQIKRMLSLFAIPVLLTVLGLILLASPDSATVLVTNIIGWVLVGIGALCAISMATTRISSVGGWILAAAFVVLGVFILSNPLILAEALGRLVGIIMAIRGVQDISGARKRKNSGGRMILAVVTLVIGIVLAMLPLTLTRTVMRLCGLVVAIVGIINIAEKFRDIKQLEEGGDPNIIDADE